MFAIIQSGGKQYRVSEGDVIRVETLSGEAGDKLDFTPVLVGGEQTAYGSDASNYKVSAEVVNHGRGKKIYIRKYRSGVQYRRRNGHRQGFTEVKITGISA